MRHRSLPALAVLACALTLPRAAGADDVVLHDTNVVLDGTLVPGTEATVYVEVRGATGLRASHPVPQAAIELLLRPAGGDADRAEPPAPVELARSATNGRGRAVVSFQVPRLDDGAYALIVRTHSRHGRSEIERPVSLVAASHLQLRPDRPVYRAGQTLRWRATLLGAANAHPIANAEVGLTISDPRGTAVWRGTETTDEVGMVSGALPLGDDLVLGRYTLAATAPGATASETVEVKEFFLPPFEIEVQTPSAGALRRGASLRGQVVARYHYGEPVRGEVVLTASGDGETERLTGRLDARGRFDFEVPVPVAAQALPLVARVTDGAGRRHEKRLELALPSDALQLAVIPEDRTVRRGGRQFVTVVTTDGRGALVPARISLRLPGRPRLVRSSPGALRVSYRAPENTHGSLPITAEASTEDGLVASQRTHVAIGARGPLLRPRRAVVGSGEAIDVRGRWEETAGPVVLTLLRDGAPLARGLAQVDGSGVLRGRIVPPAGVFGLVTLRASDQHWDLRTGDLAPRTAAASVFVEPRALDVAIRGGRRHRPGDTAELAVSVRDEAGRPVAGAGIAASVVDERVLALGAPRTDLVQALRELHDGDARAAGVAFADLLTGARSTPRRTALRAILESLPTHGGAPAIVVPASERLRSELARIARARPPLRERLVHAGAIVERTAGRWRYRRSFADELAALGWDADDRLTPWRRATSWSYAAELDPSLAPTRFPSEVGTARLAALAETLLRRARRTQPALLRDPDGALAKLAARGKVAATLTVDPWGRAVRVDAAGSEDGATVALRSAGPDGRFETADDLVHQDVFQLTGIGAYGYGAGGGGLGGRGSGIASLRTGSASVQGAVEARVRKRFDETVLWIAGVRTDARGQATLEVPLADSVTGWQVEVEAVGGAGGVGAATSRLETFLPVHLDAEVPRRLTAGDRYQVPLAVANHTAARLGFELRASVTGAAEFAGDPRQTLRVEAGEARPGHVTLRALRPGEAVLRLSLRRGGRAVDELEHRIAIEAPGSLVRRLVSAELGGSDGDLRFQVPADHAAGSARATLTLFRGASDQALDGLEGMLAEPSGCFEQTSSTTYPNLLVLELLQGRRGAEAIRARARTLVAKGYQRLLSYEVDGGGFSWFGEAPANQVLTAYGLLEFSDMDRVYPVDPALIARTRDWLLAKQQRDGSWQPDASWLHDWDAVQGSLSTTAYLAWALAESGYRGAPLERALRYLRRHRRELARSPYLTALWAASEAAAGTSDRRALAALERAAESGADGRRYSAGGATLFYARGTSADVQVTALAAQALQRRGRRGEVDEALRWLWSSRQPSYGWGTTQSTVLALRAAALAAEKEAPLAGEVAVKLDGQVVGAIDLAAPGLPTLELAGLAAGPHRVELDLPAGASVRADLRLRWRGDAAATAKAHGLEVALDTPPAPATVGDLADFALTLRNPGADTVAMPTVVVPVPPGFRVDPRSLKKVAARAEVSRAEDRGSEIAFYLQELAPASGVTIGYQLEPVASCDVLQAPARAYAYYTPEIGGASAAARVRARRRTGPPSPPVATILRLQSPPPVRR